MFRFTQTFTWTLLSRLCRAWRSLWTETLSLRYNSSRTNTSTTFSWWETHTAHDRQRSQTQRLLVDICGFISKEHRFWEGADHAVEHGRHGAEGSAQADPQRRGALSLLPLQALARGRLPGVCRYRHGTRVRALSAARVEIMHLKIKA